MQPIDASDPRTRAAYEECATKIGSSDPAVRGPAEERLMRDQDAVDRQRGLLMLQLTLAFSGCPTSTFFAISFKNTVKKCWDPSTSEHCVQDADKADVRAVIIRGMLQATGAVQRNVAEAVALIAAVDFPAVWPDALTLLVEVLTTGTDVAAVRAALSTSHSVLRKYREAGELTATLVYELRTLYTVMCPALLRSMEWLLSMAQTSGASSAAAAADTLRGITDAVECLRDITSLDLGDEFIARIRSIAELFSHCLLLPLPAAPSQGGAAAGVMIEMKSAVLACMTHWLQSYDEDFEAMAPHFIEVVVDMLAHSACSESSMDDLVVCGLEMLSSACRGTTRTYLDDTGKLQRILQQVVRPNLELREEDLETFMHDADEYIQRNMEGSNFHTRRRAAVELVHSMLRHLAERARPLLAAETQALLGAAQGSWRAKDTAIYLAFVLAVDGQLVSSQRGVATQRLSDIIPVEQILVTYVYPEITSAVSEQSPGILKADCMHVVAAFRSVIGVDAYASLVPALSHHIATGDTVVMSYAAHTLERFLSLAAQSATSPTTTAAAATAATAAAASISDVFSNNIVSVLTPVCGRLQNAETPHPYLMQYLMSLCSRFPRAVAPVAEDVVRSLTAPLHRAVQNPSNPLYSQCMFEVISKCLALQPGSRAAFEEMLWPSFAYVLRENVVEYVPYVLQVLAQLVRMHHPSGAAQSGSGDLPENYQGLVQPLTGPQLYEVRVQIPAPVSLLCAFLEVFPGYVHSAGLSNAVLNVFGTLVKLKNYDHEGLNVVTAMLLAYPASVMDTYMVGVLRVLLDRLQTAPTAKYRRILVLFLSVLVVQRQDANYLVERLNSLGEGLFMNVLWAVWLPCMQKITGVVERKTCVVALARLLCESAALQANGEAWVTSAFSCLKMLYAEVEPDDHTSFVPLASTMDSLESSHGGAAGPGDFVSVFHPLREAAPKPRDVCANIADAEAFFRDSLLALLKGGGAHFLAPLKQRLGQSAPSWLP
ncbi:CAS/CSE/importin domain protein [Novymonas esmeraldas]|uniref:CAS/CSE/importin domain protein n=1 Tax=Novymonas esmeraldas TaxID=1808958 RepID=A0AAW0EPA8_9TRYP